MRHINEEIGKEGKWKICHVDAVNASPPVLWDVMIRRRFVVGEDLVPDSEPLSLLDLEGFVNHHFSSRNLLSSFWNPPFRDVIFSGNL